jgi:tetratricopeptide (TPR) repeat protein
MRARPLHPLVLCLLAAAPLAQDAASSGGQGPQGASREAMWYAPTAEDWAMPCLVEFQRTWDDALAVAKRTQKPILVCVNMDGEIASEHYAGVRYRQPDKAALYAPYVCVIASVYRHTPRDYDEQGRRIHCPRFGSVTCGEHIAIEPVLYEQFMDGRRIAPRHIGVELEQDKAEIYDVFYAFDTDSVFAAIEKGAAGREPAPEAVDLPLEERVASRDRTDRETVEKAYLTGDRVTRRRLLEGAVRHQELDHVDLLRLALFGLDVELARLARVALAESDSEKAIDLIVETLRVPMESAERDMLLAALERLGEQYPRARTLAAVQQGLARPSSAVDVAAWSDDLAGAEYPAPSEWRTIEERVEREARASAEVPADPEQQLALAEAALALAVDPQTAEILAADYRTASDYARLHFEDARNAARAAAELGASGWRVEAVLALSAHYLGEREEAHARAAAAVAALPPGETSWNAMAVLSLFAMARQDAIHDAWMAKERWPDEWLADVNATYAVLARHPLGVDHHVAAHHDFLRSLGARARAAEILEAGLVRFPESWVLHERLRGTSLEERGVEGLEAAYATRLAAGTPTGGLEWFAGYASLVTAEYYRRAGNPAAALAAYDRAVAHYERSIALAPESRPTADHYVALAFAGRARLALEHGDHARSTSEIVAAFERKPEAAATQDGLNLSAVDTAKMLLARLNEGGERELAARVEGALARLDPVMLELPAYEREVPDAGAPRRRGRDQGR